MKREYKDAPHPPLEDVECPVSREKFEPFPSHSEPFMPTHNPFEFPEKKKRGRPKKAVEPVETGADRLVKNAFAEGHKEGKVYLPPGNRDENQQKIIETIAENIQTAFIPKSILSEVADISRKAGLTEQMAELQKEVEQAKTPEEKQAANERIQAMREQLYQLAEQHMHRVDKRPHANKAYTSKAWKKKKNKAKQAKKSRKKNK